MNYYCYANGKIRKKNDIKVGISDLLMLRGYGVFDFIRTYRGVPFRLQDYLERFENSVKGMNLKLPVSREEIIRVIYLLLKKNKRQNVGIRILLTGGYSLDSYLPSVTPNLFILIEDLPPYPAWWSEKGIKLITHEFGREMADIKTTNYLTAIRLTEERRKREAQDTLYCHNGKVLETTRNNFFLFHGNTLVTSKEDVLKGITRKAVCAMAGNFFKMEVRKVLKKELNSCTECFITGTTRGITPVTRIDDRKVGKGTPGENTKFLMRLLHATMAKECK